MRVRRAVLLIILLVALPGAAPPGRRTLGPPSPALADCPGLRLNEFLPWPVNVDWYGDGTADLQDQWIELYNGGEAGCDLGDWQLDDVAGAGSSPYTIPAGTWLEAHAFIVFFRPRTNLKLDCPSDWVRLLRPDGSPDGSLVDEFRYTYCTKDGSWARTDAGTVWSAEYPPSPGWANNTPPPTPPPPPPRYTYLPLVSTGE